MSAVKLSNYNALAGPGLITENDLLDIGLDLLHRVGQLVEGVVHFFRANAVLHRAAAALGAPSRPERTSGHGWGGAGLCSGHARSDPAVPPPQVEEATDSFPIRQHPAVFVSLSRGLLATLF